MTRRRVGDKQYGILHRRFDELARRVDEGTIPFEPTMRVLQQIIEGGLFSSESLSRIFSVAVNYDQPLEEVIGSVQCAEYNCGHSDIIKDFPSTQQGTSQIEIRLIGFAPYTRFFEAFDKLDQMGFRPATLPELLALVQAYPEVQGGTSIFAPGSVLEHSFGTLSPYFWNHNGELYLKLGWFVHRTVCQYSDEEFRFAAVRKTI